MADGFLMFQKTLRAKRAMMDSNLIIEINKPQKPGLIRNIFIQEINYEMLLELFQSNLPSENEKEEFSLDVSDVISRRLMICQMIDIYQYSAFMLSSSLKSEFNFIAVNFCISILIFFAVAVRISPKLKKTKQKHLSYNSFLISEPLL